jgi:hypothetical protein
MKRQKIAQRQAFADSLLVLDEVRPLLRRKRRPEAAGRRLRLTKAGEIRALLRLGAGGELAPRIKEAVMETLAEVIEPTVKLHMTDTHITLNQHAAQVLYGLAWEQFEEALVKANAAYNQTEWSSPHERAKELLWCSQDLKQAIEFVYELTPMPDDEIED